MPTHKYLVPVLASLLILSACATPTIAREPLPNAEARGANLSGLMREQTFDLSQPLSADALAAIAVYTNPDLNALRAGEGIAEAQLFAAGLYPDPTFSLGFDVPLNGKGLVPALGAGLGYDFAALARRPSALKGASANLDRVRLDIAWAEWLTGEQARLVSVRIGHLRGIKDQTHEFRRMADDELARALRAASRGDLPSASLEARRIAATDTADRDRAAELQLKSAELDLNRLLGIDPAEALTLAPPTKTPSALPPLDALFQYAVATRADLAGLRAGYDAAGAQTTAADLARYPLPTLGINAARDTGKINTLGPNISFNLPLWNKGRGDIAVAKASEAQLRAEYFARLETIRADIAAARSNADITARQLADVNREIAPLISQAQADDRAAARGDISTSTAQAAHMTLLDKQITAAGLALALAEYEIALEVSAGRPLESIQ